MSGHEPWGELDVGFSDETAVALLWEEARELLSEAQVFWLSTVRPDGRPHATPLIAVWLDDALHFCTGPLERKARNLAQNPQVVLTTGCNRIDEGLDVVVEGLAIPVADETTLQRIADAYDEKYGKAWHFEVRDGAFYSEPPGRVLVFTVKPTTAFGFGKGGPFSQTRWSFTQG